MYASVYALIAFFLVYTLIAVRRIKSIVVPSWVAMLIGALLMLSLQVISIDEAYNAIKFDVILFLLGMFIVVSALEVSGVLHSITLKLLGYAKSTDRLILLILVVMGTLSAFLMNDTIALVATPIILGMAKTGIDPKPLLITLAFAVTIGSAMTPIGNPQNFLIAVESGMRAPMLEFLRYLALPTLANYIVTYYILRLYFRRGNGKSIIINNKNSNDDNITHAHAHTNKVDYRLSRISKVIAGLMLLMFFIVSITEALGYDMHINMSHVAVIGALAVIALANGNRIRILRNVNYGIIILFIAMFVFMHGLEKVGVISMISSTMQLNTDSILSIVSASVILSQFMSNVPFVAFYTKVMHVNGFDGSDVKEWVALAGASTLAGNLTLLGAASNLIILEAAAKSRYTFTFLEFFKIGSIVTGANIAILLLFLTILP
jgi:Na+/H+ antiporter NhaD/arsenite permease-like protein